LTWRIARETAQGERCARRRPHNPPDTTPHNPR
jgi:hypothetical protein